MATTISSGRANSPKKLANIADHGVIYGGRGLVFDGVVDYLNIANQPSLSSFTLSLWIKPTTLSNSLIIGTDDESDYIRLVDTDTVGVRIDSSAITIDSGAVFSTGVWQYLTIVRDGSTITIYKDAVAGATTGSLAGTFNPDNIGKKGTSNPNYFYGTMSDFKIFDVALTEAQVQELYLKPEQSAPLAVRDNLVAWYPMAEGNPDSPQSVGYDHSEKGLGSEELTNNSFDDGETGYDTIGSEWTLSGGTASFKHTGQQIFKSTASVYTINKLYKTVIDIASISNCDIRILRAGSQLMLAEFGTSGIHATFAVATATGVAQMSIENVSGTATCVINSISIKEVKMGNHATTVFYGEMNDLLSSAQETALADALDATNDSFDFATGTTNLVKTDGFTASNATFVNASALGLLTNNASAQGAVSLPIATVAGKTYQVQVSTGAQNSNVAVSLSTSTSYNASNTTGNQAASQTNVALATAYTADDTSSFLVIQLASSTDTEYANLDNIKVWEVGVTTDGYDTADGEQTIPQVPLMRYNEKMVFDRYDDTVLTADDVLVGVASADHSVGVWLTTGSDVAGDAQTIFDHDNVEALEANAATKIFIASSRFNQQCGGVGGGLAYKSTKNATDISPNTLYHIVTTFDVSEYGGSPFGLKIYLNGTAQAFAVGGSLNNQSTGAVSIGACDYGFGNVNFAPFGGVIHEVAYFNTELTESEAIELFNDGVALDATDHSKVANLVGYWRNDGITTWTDRSTNSNNGTVSGTPESIVVREGLNTDKDGLGFPFKNTDKNVLRLSNASQGASAPKEDYVKIYPDTPYLNPAHEITVMCWAKNNALSPTSTQSMVAKYDSSAGKRTWDFHANTGRTLSVVFGDPSDGSVEGTTTTNATVSGLTSSGALIDCTDWHHCCFTYSSGTLIFYVNATVVGHTVSSGAVPTTLYTGGENTNYVNVGTIDNGSDYFWSGMIDEVMIYNRTLLPAEITKNYKHGKGKHS